MMTSNTLLALLLVLGISRSLASFVLEVGNEDEACFIIRLPKGRNSVVAGNYDLIDDGLSPDPVRIILLDTELNTIWKSPYGSSEGTFSIHQPPGRLSLCVQNGLETTSEDGEDRVVGVDVRVTAAESTSALSQQVGRIRTQLWNLKNHHDYMRAREAAHRDVSEQTYSYVVRWNILEGLALVIISCLQVLYLRKFFEQRSYM